MPWMVPSSPHGPCSSGKTTSTSPRVCGGCAGSCTTRSALADSRSSAIEARSPSTLGQPVGAGDPQPLGVARLEHPAAVGGDPDGHHVVDLAVDRVEHAAGGDAADGVLAGASAEDDGDAGLAVLAGGLGHRADPTGAGAGVRRTLGAMSDRTWSPATTAVTAGRPEHVPDAPLNTPITMASTYVAAGDLEYGRYGNPTWTAFEEALGALEGGRCLAFASGLATVATVLDLVGQGAMVVAPRHAYNGTVLQLADLEARGRITARLVDITDTEAVVAACDDAALVWLESPTNPALEIADIETIAAAAHEAGAYVVVDNTFATPLLPAAARRWAPTSSCTPRPSTSPVTPTSCSAPW